MTPGVAESAEVRAPQFLFLFPLLHSIFLFSSLLPPGTLLPLQGLLCVFSSPFVLLYSFYYIKIS